MDEPQQTTPPIIETPYDSRRLVECGRGRQSVHRVISEWRQKLPGKDADKAFFYVYVTVWDWLYDKAKDEGSDLTTLKTTTGGIRLTLEYMRKILEGETEIHWPTIRKHCNTRLDEFLLWEKSEMADFIFRVEQTWITRRIKQQFRLVEEMLVKGIKENKPKYLEMWLKFTGRYTGEADAETGVIFQVNEYNSKGEEKPGAVRVAGENEEETRGGDQTEERPLTPEDLTEAIVESNTPQLETKPKTTDSL